MKPLPMLATKAAPFDSDDYLFEVKWDGVRALAAVDQDSTVVDGELVVLDRGLADLPGLMRRHLRRRPASRLVAQPRPFAMCSLIFSPCAGKHS
jgi:ATP-dependent DNA ligase